MGYRELMLVVFSSVLFSLLILNLNATSQSSSQALLESEINQIAVSVAQRFIEEAKSKKFDANSDTLLPEDMPDGFTGWNVLGHGSWESYPNFNDIDDYNNFDQTLTIQSIDFRVKISVVYVSDSDPETPVSTETFFKKMTVVVSSSYLPNTVTLKHVFSYYGVPKP